MFILKIVQKIFDFFTETRTICRIKGIPIRLHVSFYAIIVFMVYRIVRSYTDGDPEWVKELANFSKFIILFSCVTLHELGHSLWAMRKGYATKDILLIAIGGLARIKKLPPTPKEEFGIAIAGPLVNLVIAVIFFIVALFFDYELINWVWQVNIAILLFNLIPAYPMDGGRIFRSILNLFMRAEKATKVAQVIALGFFSIFVGGGFYIKAYNLIFIGFFMSAMIGLELVLKKKKPELFYETYTEIETPLGTVTSYLDEDNKKFVINGPKEAIVQVFTLHSKCAIPGCGKNPVKQKKAYLIDFEKGISVCSPECRKKYQELYENTTN